MRTTNIPCRQFRHCNQAKLLGFHQTNTTARHPAVPSQKNKMVDRRKSLLHPHYQSDSCPVISVQNDIDMSQELSLCSATTPTKLLRRWSSMEYSERLLCLSTKVLVPSNSFDPFADPEEDLLEDQEDPQYWKQEMREKSRACRGHAIQDHEPRALESYAAAGLYLPTPWSSRFD